MQLFVRNSAGQTVTLSVPASASIGSVLSKVLMRFEGWAGQHRQALSFGGTPLEPGRRLSEYSVFNHATLQLLSLQLGGMWSDSDWSDSEVMDAYAVEPKSTQP